MTTHTDSPINSWQHAAEWILLSSAGWAAAAWATTTTLGVARALWPANVATTAYAISVMASAIAIALLQWVVIRSVTPLLGRWLFASSIGLVLATVVPMPLKLLDWHIGASRLQWDELLYGFVFGALLGAGQGLALWGRSRRLAIWIVCSALGWAFATAITALLPFSSDVAANWVSPALWGAVASLGTGLALAYCLKPASMHRPGPLASAP